MPKLLTILAPGFEETEAVTVIDLLRRAEIEVVVAGLNDFMVTGSHDITIQCDRLLSEVISEDFDGLFLPGGQPGSTHLKNDSRVLDLVQRYYADHKLVTAICAAPTVLHAAGILEGKKVTSYPSEEDVFSGSTYMQDRVIQDGNIVTSRGVGTAIEFGLHLIEILQSPEAKHRHARRILWSV